MRITTAVIHEQEFTFSLIEVVLPLLNDIDECERLISSASTVLPSPIFLVAKRIDGNGYTWCNKSGNYIPETLMKILNNFDINDPMIVWEALDIPQ